jgi:peroxiredoxin
VDPPNVSRNLCERRGYTFTFLSDSKAEVIRRYDLLHVGGGPGELDISSPAEILVDSSGIVRWVNFTEDVRVRARADEILSAAGSAMNQWSELVCSAHLKTRRRG